MKYPLGSLQHILKRVGCSPILTPIYSVLEGVNASLLISPSLSQDTVPHAVVTV